MSASETPSKLTSWRQMKRSGRPTVFNIPATAHFVEALATGLKADAGDNPLSLACMTVLMPTRRACRALREAFLRLGNGAPVLLPRLLPLNDLDEDEALLTGFASLGEAAAEIPPAIDPLRRQLLLAALILKRDNVSHDQAVALAAELGRLLDQMQTENVPFDKLKTLVPDDYAKHWQQTLTFLEIVTEYWPAILAGEGCVDPVKHRNQVFAAQAKAWKDRGGQLTGPIIAAGSTGSIPATADLLSVIAHLPEGCVVLPGLDQTLDDSSWAEIEETHPQFGIQHLLKKLSLTRDEVWNWPGCTDARANSRVRFVSEVMRPSRTTDQWTDLTLAPDAHAGLERIVAPTSREEAASIAMVMREALESPNKTCAMVTPDRDLALRVTSELERWGININDSAGRDLAIAPVGVYLRLLAEMVASDFAPLAVLSVCKHPLAAAGLDAVAFRDLTRLAERALLRGPRPAPGLAALRALAKDKSKHTAELTRWIDRLEHCCTPFITAMSQTSSDVAALLEAHMRCAEALAATHDTDGALRLWAGEDGESAAAFVAELARACDALPPLAPAAYPALFATLLKGRVVRPRFGQHPRLAILGPLEARLQRFDTVILAGLNEGTWPGEPAPDPWMSRPMRAKLGLPSPERKIGLSAHDVAEALCGPRVILSRALKVEGAPTVPSRWLMRLDQVIAAAKLPALPLQSPWLAHAHAITRPLEAPKAWPAPAPCPPVSARPRRLSVTKIETWMRDPYAIYAEYVLGLRALDPIDADVNAADYGMLIHQALQDFIAENTPLQNGEQRLLEIGKDLFARSSVSPAVRAFWWPRFQRIAHWFVDYEKQRRADIKKSFVEIRGTLKLNGPAGDFELVAKADRIDVKIDGAMAIIDYKTGIPPTPKEVMAGFAPQLPLEAVMALENGFPGVTASRIAELSFWHLHGRDEGASDKTLKGQLDQIVSEAHAGLRKLIATYDNPATAYPAQPNPEHAPRYNDYEHLARVKEWASSGESES